MMTEANTPKLIILRVLFDLRGRLSFEESEVADRIFFSIIHSIYCQVDLELDVGQLLAVCKGS